MTGYDSDDVIDDVIDGEGRRRTTKKEGRRWKGWWEKQSAEK